MSQRPREFEARDGRKLPIFIHQELDDYGLSPIEFRVYARVARRAGGGSVHRESVTKMAKAWKVSERTIRRCFDILVTCGLIAEKQRPGQTTLYALTPSEDWKPANDLDFVRKYVLRSSQPRTSETVVTPDMTDGGTPDMTDGTPRTPETVVPRTPETDEVLPVKLHPEKKEKEKEKDAPLAWTKKQNDKSADIAAKATRYAKADNDTPAIVLAIAKVAQNWKPDKDTWPALAEQFPAPIDEPLLKTCFTAWRLKGYRKENLAWLTQWYAQGHPDEYQHNSNGKPAAPVIRDCNDAIMVADYGDYYFVESCNGDGGTSPRYRTAEGMARQREWTMEEVYAYRPKEYWPPGEKYPHHEDTIGGGNRPVTVW